MIVGGESLKEDIEVALFKISFDFLVDDDVGDY